MKKLTMIPNMGSAEFVVSLRAALDGNGDIAAVW